MLLCITPARAVMLAAGLALSCAALSQDLPPGVLLLSRVKHHTEKQLQHLPDISCLETVQREHTPANGKARSVDTVRLEVLTSDSREFFASPGDRKFSDRPPISYAGSGALGDGVFGLYLKNVLLNNNVSTTYKGEEEIDGRRLARWDYRLPLMWSGQTIELPEGSGRVGLHGSFWADPETNDVVRLELNGDDFPLSLPLTEAVWRIDYAPVAVSEGIVALLPQSSEFRMARFTGETDRNQIEFTHCRAFAVQSAIRFDSADSVQTPTFGIASLDETLRPLPPGLSVAVNLRTHITAGTAVGAMIDGTIAANVPAKGAVIIPAGSPVRGRIRRLERVSDPFPYYIVALEFTEVELQGIRHRFYAGLLSIGSAAGVEAVLSVAQRTEEASLGPQGRATRKTAESLTVPSLPGVATFFFKGAKLDLPPGFRTEWKTRALAP